MKSAVQFWRMLRLFWLWVTLPNELKSRTLAQPIASPGDLMAQIHFRGVLANHLKSLGLSTAQLALLPSTTFHLWTTRPAFSANSRLRSWLLVANAIFSSRKTRYSTDSVKTDAIVSCLFDQFRIFCSKIKNRGGPAGDQGPRVHS